MDTRSSMIVIMIVSFLMPKPTGTSLAAAQSRQRLYLSGNWQAPPIYPVHACNEDSWQQGDIKVIIHAVAQRRNYWELTGTPCEAIHVDGPHSLLQSGQVRVIIPRLDVQEHRGLPSCTRTQHTQTKTTLEPILILEKGVSLSYPYCCRAHRQRARVQHAAVASLPSFFFPDASALAFPLCGGGLLLLRGSREQIVHVVILVLLSEERRSKSRLLFKHCNDSHRREQCTSSWSLAAETGCGPSWAQYVTQRLPSPVLCTV